MRKLFAFLVATGVFATMSIAPSLACGGDKECDGSKCPKGAKAGKKAAKETAGAKSAAPAQPSASPAEKPAETK